MSEKYLLIFISLSFLCLSCSYDNASNKSRGSDEIKASIVEIEKIDEIELAIKDDIFLGKVTYMVTKDSFIILGDIATNILHQFSTSGDYVTKIGNVGKGPGEYLHVGNLAIDENDFLILCEPSGNKMHIYDKERVYVKTKSFGDENFIIKIALDSLQNILQLVYRNNKFFIQKIGKTNSDPTYSVCLNMNTFHSVFTRTMEKSVGFCYRYASDKIYFKEPPNYKIREINAQNGQVENTFGVKPFNFKTISSTISDQINVQGFIEVLKKVSFSKNMCIIDDRFLLVDFHEFNTDSPPQYLVYDLENDYKAYTLGHAALAGNEVLSSFRNMLYSYVPPKDEELNKNNGYVKVFILNLK